jgi:hypothetical protein
MREDLDKERKLMTRAWVRNWCGAHLVVGLNEL